MAEKTKTKDNPEAGTSPDAGTNPPEQEGKKARKAKEVEGIFVRARTTAGFRRAGFHFTPEGTGIALDALGKEQLAAIESEPMLLVERVTFPADAAGE